MERSEVPLLIENVDIDRYKAADRKIRHALPKSTPQLGAMVINFAHSRDLGVPSGSRQEGMGQEGGAALKALFEGGYLEPLYGHWHDMGGGRGRCAVRIAAQPCLSRRSDSDYLLG